MDLVFGMVGDEWRGPQPPKWGKWVEIKPGPRGGKRWVRAGDDGEAESQESADLRRRRRAEKAGNATGGVETAAKAARAGRAGGAPKQPRQPRVERPTVDAVHTAIQRAMMSGKPVTVDDVNALAVTIGQMRDVDIRELRVKLEMTKTGGRGVRKAGRISGIVDKLMEGIEIPIQSEIAPKSQPELQSEPELKITPETPKSIPKPKPKSELETKRRTMDQEEPKPQPVQKEPKRGSKRYERLQAVRDLMGDVNSKDTEPSRGEMRDIARMVSQSKPDEQRVLLDVMGLQHVTNVIDIYPALIERNAKAKSRSEEEWRSHPSIKAFGEKLTIKGIEDPVTQKNLKDLTKIPEHLATRVGNSLREVAVGNLPVTELDHNEFLKGVKPRGWHQNTWDKVAGAYNPGSKTVTIGKGNNGSISLSLHEFGHAVGDVYRLDSHPDLVQIHKEIFDKLTPYLQQEGPGSLSGCEELFAEGFATILVDRELAIRQYGDRFVNWMESKVINGA